MMAKNSSANDTQQKMIENHVNKSHSPGVATRHLYRHASVTANLQHAFSETDVDADCMHIPMTKVDREKLTSSSEKGGQRSTRSRAVSTAVSIRSRKASRAEYHADLKPSLHQGLTCNLVFTSAVILIGTSFQFGYNIGVLNQPEQLIKQFYNSTYTARFNDQFDGLTLTMVWALTTTIFFLPGGMIGAFSAGYAADRFGRRRAVIISNVLALFGAAASSSCRISNLPELLMVGRLVTGIHCGMATQLAPLYLAEITPFNLRGAFGTTHQLFITVGIFVSNLLGLKEIFGTSELWQYLMLVSVVPSVISLLFLLCLPDSPRYLLLNRNKRAKAASALRFLRQRQDVSADLEEMETECADDEVKKYSLLSLLSTRKLWMPLLVTVVLQIAQQLSGINAIFFYSTSIYKNAGVPDNRTPYAVLLTSAVNVVMTTIAVPAMDKAGRRPLLLGPMVVMVIILAVITAALKFQQTWLWMSYVSIGCFVGYVVCFSLGLGPIPMLITAELFRQGPRTRAMSLAGTVNWLFTAVVALCFPFLQVLMKEYAFLIFFFLMIMFTIFVYKAVPETKNKTFEQIASEFQPGDELEVEEVVDDEVFHGETGELVVESEDELDRLVADKLSVCDPSSPKGVVNEIFWSVRL